MSIGQRKSAAVRRDEIVQAALALIAGSGPGALTTGAIARHVGVSQAALFRHYPTKNAILVACVESIGDQVRPAVFAAAAAPGAAEQRLRRIVGTMLSVARNIPGDADANVISRTPRRVPGVEGDAARAQARPARNP